LLCTDDLDTVECGQDFDIVWSHSVLIHMDPPTVASALRLMARALRPGGTAYFTMNLGPERILGTWIYGPNYQHPFPAHPALDIREVASLDALGDVVWCPPDSGMRAVMLAARRRDGALVGQRTEAEPAVAG
jgi:SAM-dependent methyltransferase